jgi:hypothetical protein
VQRSEFLKYGAGVFGAVALGGAGGLFWRSARTGVASSATSSEIILAQFTYKGHDVQIVQIGDHVFMVLDGRTLPHYAFMQLRPDRYASHLLPFRDESTPRALAEKLIDNDGRLFIL